MARGTAEKTQRHPATPSPAPRVRDFSGTTRTFDVVFDARTAYDFLISAEIGKGDEQDLLPEDHQWLRKSQEELSADQVKAIETCFGEHAKGIFHGLESLVVRDQSIKTAKDVVHAVDTVGARGLARVVIEDNVTAPVSDDLIERALDANGDAIDELVPQVADWDKENVKPFLNAYQDQYGDLQVGLAAWLPRFEIIENRVRRFQTADVASRKADLASLDSTALVEKVTGGLRWIPDAARRRVILAPSYFSRPFNYIYQGGDWRLFAYPIADAILEATDHTTPPSSIVRLYRTLGDQTRLRTLKLLSERDWYLTELATQLELSKPTMKHHLAQMRAAGLVTVTEEGSLTYYSLRRERLAEAGLELHRFLG